jgi:monofunctional biosynthetic peptidoglycan transglycosylase
VRQRWVDWQHISSQAKVAVIAAEDQTFPDHKGFDFKSINDALEERERGRRIRGASTISQQVAKNLFLWPGQSWARKGLEAWFTVLIESLWPKQRILEVYLNVAEFGRGVYGVSAAADVFFHKSAARLNASEAALLAAVLPNPKRMRVNAPSRYVRLRQEWILAQMRRLGGTSLLKRLES